MAEELLSPAPHNSAGSQQLAHTGENENHALYGELVHLPLLWLLLPELVDVSKLEYVGP